MEFMQKRNESIKKKEELYQDDQPYDAQYEEQLNEEAQIEAM